MEEQANDNNDTKEAEQEDYLFKRNKYIFDFALETYYDLIKDKTPRTIFIELSADQIGALFMICKKYAPQQSTEESPQINLQKLIKQVDEVIKQEFGGNSFVKLSTRSPKDSITGEVNDRMKSFLTVELDKAKENLKKSNNKDLTLKEYENADSVAFVKASRKCLVVHSGQEAIELFYKSSRIYEDLMKAEEHPNKFKLSIIIREWIEMDPALEFRGFVFNHSLNAISQYCYYQFFDFLPKCKDQIQTLLTSFYDKEIKNIIPHTNCVIDFAICKNSNNNTNDSNLTFDDPSQWRVMIIELNPFFTDTGACMFSWKNPEDVAIIKGEKPLQFRVLQQVVDCPLDCFHYKWKEFISEYQGRKKNAKPTSNNNNNSEKSCSVM
eukprot:CAMPEP_0168574356 /NCGR_PEP_ID=MMETSP0413-20121227/19032_1 /TAXON_ID=136452 /ORGANISM="Filamoeba nolandi, Strain NC-AS-23-1" /LENGTH=380 /DNA_ID=CAMNT_0008607683 /DNA_START=165 /DNA_END=1307 /DNA_ORIENTATION=-